MMRSKESATVHSSKELHCRSFIVNVGKKKKKKKRLEHWVGNKPIHSSSSTHR